MFFRNNLNKQKKKIRKNRNIYQNQFSAKLVLIGIWDIYRHLRLNNFTFNNSIFTSKNCLIAFEHYRFHKRCDSSI